MPISSPAPSTPRPRDGPAARRRWRCSAEERGVLQKPVGGDRVEHRQGRGRAHRVAPERGAVLPGLQQLARRAQADTGPDGEAAAEALSQRDDVRDDAGVLAGEAGAGAADAGLHLVEDEQRAALRGDLPGRREVARRRRDGTPSPMIGSRKTAAVSASTASASAATSPYGTWETPGVSGSNGVLLLCWPVSASAPIVRPWKASSAAMISAARAAGHLERGFVGLRSGVAEEHPPRRCRAAPAAARPAPAAAR